MATYKKKEKTQQNAIKNKTNSEIRHPEVRLVGENGEMLGVMSSYQAMKLAMEAELDLVEISPNAAPPVCKIMDFGKFKYEQQKKASSAVTVKKVKEIQLGVKIGQHDLEIKVKHAEEFLLSKHDVRLVMILKGRDMQLIDQAHKMMEEIESQLSQHCKTVDKAKLTGRKIIALYHHK